MQKGAGGSAGKQQRKTNEEGTEDTREEKDLVRGYTFAEYHADVYDRTEEEVTIAGRLHARLHKLYFCLYLHF